MNTTLNGRWDATAFFRQLVGENVLAQRENFTFCRVSGLDGFEEAISRMQNHVAFVCVSDIADGYTELNNTPRTRRVKTVFLAMRHAAEDMDARSDCMETMRELFRQFMSRLILEKVRLEENCIYLDTRITFTEIDRYFFSGAACAYFQIAVDVFTDLRYDGNEWGDYLPGIGEDYLYDLWYIDQGLSEKMPLIKAIRSFTNLSLVEAKEMAENPPQLVVGSLSREMAEKHLATIEETGAIAKIVLHGRQP
ncbi:MAG: ribosomal protein L7/L12 [Muribaculaceae bacterium]|nr:ribosomal protein L7/L12 [Muribaculaceae bacterium]